MQFLTNFGTFHIALGIIICDEFQSPFINRFEQFYPDCCNILVPKDIERSC